MVSIDEAVTAKYESFGKSFEVLVDPKLAFKLKKGENVNFSDLLAADKIFSDAGKGDVAPSADLNKVFGTVDVQKIAKKIIVDGKLELTTEQRKELTVQRGAEIVAFIAKNAFNPQTKLPIPPQRIENALEQVKFHVDPFKGVKEQVDELMPKLKTITPISIQTIRIKIKVPPQFSGAVSSMVHRYKLERDSWLNDGSYEAIVEMPAGLQTEFFSKLNSVTHGSNTSELL